MAKLEKMVRYIPSLYDPGNNTNINAILKSFATEDDLVVGQVEAAKDQLFVQYSQSQYLDLLGSNVGVLRQGVGDNVFRQLIPILSFHPKQVRITIQALLDVFFGVGNSVTGVFEVNANEIIVRLPSTATVAGATGSGLRGSIYLKSYNGSVVSINDISPKTITVDLIDTDNSITVDEWATATFGQGLYTESISSNTSGTTSIVLSFPDAADLSVFNTTDIFNIKLTTYPGNYMPDPSASYQVTSQRGILGQNISVGASISVLVMQDASGIPDDDGEIIFDFGNGLQEGPIDYFGRPNNTTLFIDGGYTFTNSHLIGGAVNMTVTPYNDPRINGQDYSIYLTDVTSSVTLVENLILDIVAAGVVVTFIEVTV